MTTVTGTIVAVHHTWPLSFALRVASSDIEVALDEYTLVTHRGMGVWAGSIRAGHEVRVDARSDRAGMLVASAIEIESPMHG